MSIRNRPGSFSRNRGKVKPRVVNLDGQEAVRMTSLPNGGHLPLVIQPALEGLDFHSWFLRHQELLEKKLIHHGALLFRDFGLTQETFFAHLRGLPWPMMKYLESSTPRKEVGKNIYTSTEYPPEQSIALHNELSTARTFPLKVWFFCEIEPGERGQTPIADTRAICRRIDPGVLETFREKGWSLIRNYGSGMGISWQDAFKTQDRDQVEAYCRAQDIGFEWHGERLRTHQQRPALLTHPVSGETSWFNHMAFWHPATLCPETRREMEAQFGVEGLPYHTFYGDGSIIPDEVALHIRDAYLAEKITFDWRKGDLLLIDNILTSHGREPFGGDRKILVAMGNEFERKDLGAASPNLTSEMV
jgi:alpha-ketoglutarate-dependent taurine dioxygenase